MFLVKYATPIIERILLHPRFMGKTYLEIVWDSVSSGEGVKGSATGSSRQRRRVEGRGAADTAGGDKTRTMGVLLFADHHEACR